MISPSLGRVSVLGGHLGLQALMLSDSGSQRDGLASGCCLASRPTPERVRFATGRRFGHIAHDGFGWRRGRVADSMPR
jgi:hypothetical protein